MKKQPLTVDALSTLPCGSVERMRKGRGSLRPFRAIRATHPSPLVPVVSAYKVC